MFILGFPGNTSIYTVAVRIPQRRSIQTVTIYMEHGKGEIMIEVSIGFKQAKDIVDFVQKMNRFTCNADLVSGNRAVDAKSLMGALAISQAADLKLVIYENSQSETAELLAGLKEFAPGEKKKDEIKIM